MNRQRFKEILEKLELQNPRTVEVLRMVLAGDTDAQIALLRGRNKGTIRKQISKIYRDFGIKGKFPGDRQSRRDELIALFHKYHPEWVHDCSPAVTNEVSDEGKKVNLNPLSQPLSSSSTKESETGDELMTLAITTLEQWGFNQKFKVNRTFQCIGYWLKNIETEANEFKLVLYKNEQSLYVSIKKEILEPYLLNFKYYQLDDNLRILVNHCVIGRILVLPSNKENFLDSLNFNYWSLLRTHNQIEGDLYLNDYTINYFSGYRAIIVDSILLDEFDLDNISKKETYLIVNEDQRFPYNLQVCINSNKALQEFLDYFGKQIMENQ